MQGSRAVADSDETASSPTVPAIAAAWVVFSLSLLQLLRYARFNLPAARSLARMVALSGYRSSSSAAATRPSASRLTSPTTGARKAARP